MQKEKQESKPNAGFKMPEIVIEHESWGRKALRALFPQKWYMRVLEGVVLLVLLAVVCWAIGVQAPQIKYIPHYLGIIYLVDFTFAFIRDVVATLKARRSEKVIISELKRLETSIQENPKPVDTTNLDKFRK